MTQPLPVPLDPSVYRRLLRLSGGRKAVPKGGSLDRELIETLNMAVKVGAARERSRVLRLAAKADSGAFFEETKGWIARLCQAVQSGEDAKP